MSSSVRKASTPILLVLGLLVSLVLAVGAPTSAQAADDKGLVNGNILFPQKDSPRIKMLWFDQDWGYLGAKSASGGGYSIWLDPGTYHLQFVDQREAYDTKKYAPTDIQVTVHANDLTNKNVKMTRGAVITGTAKAGGKPLKSARIVAANTARQSFATTANKAGQFAIGGLPQGKYSVFTYDQRKDWVDKSTWAGLIKPGNAKNLAIKLKKPAGSMTVYLFTHNPDGRLGTKTSVTVTSRKTGQWWTATANHGTAVLKGLYPGGYTLKFDGAGVWFAKTGTVEKASVKPGRMAFGSFHLTKRGGWLTGTVVDRGAPSITLTPPWTGATGAMVTLFDQAGNQVASTYSDAQGDFRLSGRLATQSGLTIAIDPTPQSGGYMNGAGYCHFEHGEFTGFSVTTGRESQVGDLALSRTPPPTGQTPSPTCDPGAERQAARSGSR